MKTCIKSKTVKSKAVLNSSVDHFDCLCRPHHNVFCFRLKGSIFLKKDIFYPRKVYSSLFIIVINLIFMFSLWRTD